MICLSAVCHQEKMGTERRYLMAMTIDQTAVFVPVQFLCVFFHQSQVFKRKDPARWRRYKHKNGKQPHFKWCGTVQFKD